MPDTAAITPFTIDTPQADLDDLRQRLLTTRWPDAQTVDDTSQGPRLEKVRALVDHWATAYDWRRTEALLNSWGQHTTRIDGLDVHFLHVRSSVPGARPLLLTHGWPGSVLEFRHAIGPLTDPVAHGGDGGRLPPRDPEPARIRVLREAHHDRVEHRPHREGLVGADVPARVHGLVRPGR
nr:epoxide hydrolase N-terminal domain-containing protein [Curtobacterium flaccumfaciens]